jgi:hypothetical protein
MGRGAGRNEELNFLYAVRRRRDLLRRRRIRPTLLG